MEIENVKFWQWALAGIIAGLMFSTILYVVGPSFDTQARDTIEQGEFENTALADTRFDPTRGRERTWIDKYHKNQPLLKDVVVHPPLSGDKERKYWVTGRTYWIGLRPVDPTKIGGPQQICEEWKPFKYQTSAPYKPGYEELAEKKGKKLQPTAVRAKFLADMKTALGGVTEFPTVKDYLTAVARVPASTFHFRYAWWELPQALWTLPPFAGLLVIGMAWPMALGVMQNIGLAKPPPAKPKPRQATRPMPAVPSTAAVVVKPAAPPPPPPAETDSRKYGGEFYPVVKSTGKE